MRKFLIASIVLSAFTMVGPAMAADMAVKTAPLAAAPFTWTGYYIGGNVGYGWGNDPTSTTGRYLGFGGGALSSGGATQHLDGAFTGLQSGYNWQFAPTWVAGIESDFQYGKIKGTISCLLTCGGALPPVGTGYTQFTVTDALDSFGTVRARLGYAMGSTLFYGTGGFAYGDIERTGLITGRGPSGNGAPFGPLAGNYDDSTTKGGWTVGGGVETKLPGMWSAWSAKAEYLHIDLGHVSDILNENYFSGAPGAFRNITTSVRENIVRVGLNYQFNTAH
jgi:outer membrane immunogenic protein